MVCTTHTGSICRVLCKTLLRRFQYRAHRDGLGALCRAYEDSKAFTLFLVDIGLLSCMVRLQQSTLLDGNELFKEFKGALTEQYVVQQIKMLKGIETCYWANDRSSAEVDFMIDTGSDVIPIEVKAELNLQAKSLKVYREKFDPPSFDPCQYGGLQRRGVAAQRAALGGGGDRQWHGKVMTARWTQALTAV